MDVSLQEREGRKTTTDRESALFIIWWLGIHTKIGCSRIYQNNVVTNDLRLEILWTVITEN